MFEGIPIVPNAIYDNAVLINTYGFSPTSMKKARDSGALKHTRQGNRILYVGQWVLDWLEHDAFSRLKQPYWETRDANQIHDQCEDRA